MDDFQELSLLRGGVLCIEDALSGRFYFRGKKGGSCFAGAKPLVPPASSPQISAVAPESVPFLLGSILTETRHCKTHRLSHIISFPPPHITALATFHPESPMWGEFEEQEKKERQQNSVTRGFK